MVCPCLFSPGDNFKTSLALPTRWRASVHALSYRYLLRYMIQEGEITVEKCAHRGASVRRERHTLSLGRNKQCTFLIFSSLTLLDTEIGFSVVIYYNSSLGGLKVFFRHIIQFVIGRSKSFFSSYTTIRHWEDWKGFFFVIFRNSSLGG